MSEPTREYDSTRLLSTTYRGRLGVRAGKYFIHNRSMGII